MAEGGNRAGLVLGAAASVAFALLAHASFVTDLSPAVGAALSLVPLAGFAAFVLRPARSPALALAVAVAAAAALWSGWSTLERHFPDLFFLEHAGVNLLLATIFGRTLMAGREPLCTRFARLLHRHLPADDVFSSYADQLVDDGLGESRLRGYLTGSLDAVLRLPGPQGERRYVVVDYKTNRLAAPDVELTTWHYRPAAMAQAMMQAHYPLQLLLYSVALHRFLRWRQPGYAPERHLGGGLYLFVRGMSGPGTPVVDGGRCGVMAWRPPDSLVVALSALLAGSAEEVS
jgi:hypothetical protein